MSWGRIHLFLCLIVLALILPSTFTFAEGTPSGGQHGEGGDENADNDNADDKEQEEKGEGEEADISTLEGDALIAALDKLTGEALNEALDKLKNSPEKLAALKEKISEQLQKGGLSKAAIERLGTLLEGINQRDGTARPGTRTAEGSNSGDLQTPAGEGSENRSTQPILNDFNDPNLNLNIGRLEQQHFGRERAPSRANSDSDEEDAPIVQWQSLQETPSFSRRQPSSVGSAQPAAVGGGSVGGSAIPGPQGPQGPPGDIGPAGQPAQQPGFIAEDSSTRPGQPLEREADTRPPAEIQDQLIQIASLPPTPGTQQLKALDTQFFNQLKTPDQTVGISRNTPITPSQSEVPTLKEQEIQPTITQTIPQPSAPPSLYATTTPDPSPSYSPSPSLPPSEPRTSRRAFESIPTIDMTPTPTIPRTPTIVEPAVQTVQVFEMETPISMSTQQGAYQAPVSSKPPPAGIVAQPTASPVTSSAKKGSDLVAFKQSVTGETLSTESVRPVPPVTPPQTYPGFPTQSISQIPAAVVNSQQLLNFLVGQASAPN